DPAAPRRPGTGRRRFPPAPAEARAIPPVLTDAHGRRPGPEKSRIRSVTGLGRSGRGSSPVSTPARSSRSRDRSHRRPRSPAAASQSVAGRPSSSTSPIAVSSQAEYDIARLDTELPAGQHVGDLVLRLAAGGNHAIARLRHLDQAHVITALEPAVVAAHL